MMHCFFTPAAESDLEEIGDYIAADSPARALLFVQQLRRVFHILLDMCQQPACIGREMCFNLSR